MSRPVTLRAALDAAARRLGDAGVADPRREAQVLLGHVLGLDRAAILGAPERLVAADQRDALDALVARRAGREPAAYIVGEREFWSLPFLVTRDTLIPRPDSETVVEAALAACPDRSAPRRLLDLGTGTGCLLLALASELPGAWGVGVDVSRRALAVARRNADRLGLAGRAAFLCGDWGRALAGRFDVVVVNPPYVGTAEAAGLAPEITAFEPDRAVFSGADPLACFRALLPDVARLLGDAGVAVVEVGAGQAAAVGRLAHAAGLAEIERRRDLGGIERCLVLRPGDREK